MLYTSSGQSHKRKLSFKQDILRQTSTSGKVTFQSNFKFQDDNTKFLNLPATNINVTLQSSGLSNAETPKYWVGLSNPRHQNAGLVSSGVSNISWREGVSLALPYGVDVLLHQPASHSSSPNGLVTTESEALNHLRLTQEDECWWQL